MTDLRYPAFPKRAFVAAGAALLVLMAVAVVVNKNGPSVGGCARAAERVMAARDYTVQRLELTGPRAVPACRGLSDAQYVQALLDTYQIEYGRLMPRVPISYAVPPPSYKARSARSQPGTRP